MRGTAKSGFDSCERFTVLLSSSKCPDRLWDSQNPKSGRCKNNFPVENRSGHWYDNWSVSSDQMMNAWSQISIYSRAFMGIYRVKLRDRFKFTVHIFKTSHVFENHEHCHYYRDYGVYGKMVGRRRLEMDLASGYQPARRVNNRHIKIWRRHQKQTQF